MIIQHAHMQTPLVPLTPDGQVVYVHLVPVVILYSIDKGIPFDFV